MNHIEILFKEENVEIKTVHKIENKLYFIEKIKELATNELYGAENIKKNIPLNFDILFHMAIIIQNHYWYFNIKNNKDVKYNLNIDINNLLQFQDIQQHSTYDLIYNESKQRNNKIFEENSSPYAKNEKINDIEYKVSEIQPIKQKIPDPNNQIDDVETDIYIDNIIKKYREISYKFDKPASIDYYGSWWSKFIKENKLYSDDIIHIRLTCMENEIIRNIKQDKDDNNRMKVDKEIIKVKYDELKNIQNTDHFDFKITNYSLSDGLQGKEFNTSSAVCTSDGEIFFGGPDGLNAFYPDEIKEDDQPAKMIFRDFRIFNKSIPYGQNYDNRIILDKPIFNTNEIELKYSENSFTIEFIALNYFYPEKNNYAYKLDGFNNQWITTDGKKNSATYTNLNNGTYTFHVKEVKGNSNGKEISLKIVVLPPFWKSWMAYLIYAIVIFLILIFLRQLIIIRERINMRIENERIENQHIHEIDSLKIKFFTNISHEFRTPLTLIMAPVEKLLSELKEKPEAKYLKLIEQNARRLLLMVNQLLDFRKLEVQGFNYNPSMGDIVSFLNETVLSFKNLSEQKHIQLVFRTKIKELNTFFDKDKLEKIMFNLLSNAFKFTPGYGLVSVSIKIKAVTNDPFNSEKHLLVIKVEDTGIGIPADKIDKIFTRFFQVDSTGQVEKGTGIGLSLVAEFVKLHEGEIFVTSEIQKGSCFKVILPINNSGLSVPVITTVEEIVHDHYVATENIENLNPSTRPVLLIAEDNDDLRFYLKDNLLQKYHIYEASNGVEALKIITHTTIDLIISDIMMPQMDGIELCRRVKSDRTICHIPLILLTARSSEQQQLEGLETGADDYVTKPFNFQILEAKISNIISLRRNARQVFRSKIHIEAQDIAVTSLDEQFMRKALELVEKNMGTTDYSVEAMSRDMGMSRTLLYKKILALTGRPPLEFVRSLRLKRAALLLSKSQMNVSEIAFQVGFNDPKYFSKHFKNEFGVLPSKYIAKTDSSNNRIS